MRASTFGEIRMAISCLAFPVDGRPTRRARRSWASVASGISVRSSMLSGICRAFFARCLACADDANRFLVILHSSGINNKDDPADRRETDSYGSKLRLRVFNVIVVQPIGIAKTVAASSKETPCFLRLARALRASQENTLLYIR